MDSEKVFLVKQLANRLESASSGERIDALQELQSLARSHPDIVGEHSLQRVLNFLKEQGSAEEYQESLDVLYRLVKSKDKIAAKANTTIVLSDLSNTELLLDLLEHEDLTVGVMTSQILTEIHANDGPDLEAAIQQCPDGMNKLLQRLPDSSREEVRNQAIVLITQLTSKNEEMKKTVVFNEGFEILFGIIKSEGGTQDAGMVVQDCLQICSNILDDSETCQRLFFGMGVDWIFRLVDFFDAMVLESLNAGNRNFDEDLGEADNSPWFEQPTRLICAVLALRSLYHSLSKHNPKHQMQIASGTSVVLPSACYWIARNGPADLVSAGLSLIKRVVDENIDAGSKLSNMIIKVPPAQSGKNIPSGIVVPTLQFGWKPLPTDDRKFISLMALLAERYVYPCECWSPSSGDAPSIKDEEFEISATIDNYANACAEVFETILSVDQTTSDLLIQYILAPAPPPAIEPGEFADPSSVGQLDTMKPLGSILLNLLVEGCDRISSSQYPVIGMPSNVGKRSESDTIERASNLLSLLFVHGSQLAKELATAIHTGHTSGNISGANKQLLPLLLSSAGRAARMPSGSGSNILIALLRLLSTAASGCERAAKQLLDDPANLFVVDLATVSSESAGISPIVQVASSFFLGCCLQALPEPVEGDSTAAADSDGSISRRSFLAMIDGKIGLSRFSELLKRPLIPYRQNFGGINYNTFFISKGYRKFYEAQVEIIRGGIYEFYAGSAAAGGVDSVHQQIIALQNEKITELESKLESLQYNTNDDHNSLVNEPAGVSRASASVTEQLQKMLGEKDNELESYKKKEEDLTKSHEAELNVFKQQLEVADRLIPQYKETIENLQKEKDELHSNLSEKINTLNQSLLAAQAEANNLKHELSTAEERFNSDMMSENKDISINFEDQIVGLKKIILDVEEEKKNMKDSLDQKDRKIQLLTSELSSFNGDQSESITNLEKQVVELENRNAELVKQLWATQSELVSVKDASDDYNVAVNRDTEDSNGIVLTLWDSVATLISNLGIDVDDMEEIKERILNTDNGLKDRCSLIDYFVNQIIDSIQSAVGECSDIAEGAGIIQLDGYEGTIARVVDCCAKLSGKLMESSLKAEESDRFRSQLDDAENEIEVLQADKDALEEELLEFKTLLENAEKGKEAIKTQLYTIEDEYNTLEKQYQALLLKQDTNGSIHDSLEVSDDAINSSEIRIELDHTTVLYHQATESLARKEKEILDLCEKFSREGEVSEAKYLNLVKEKKELDSKYDDLVESFQNSELQRNQLENKIHSLEMEVNYLQDQQAETVDHATHQELNNTFTALSAEFDKQRIVIAEKDEELQRLSEKYSLLEQKLIASAATLTSALQERDQIKSELEQKRLLIEELESSSHAAKSGASYTDLDNEIKDLRRHLAIQESQIEVYTLTISEKDAEIDALRLKLSSSDDGDINASLALKNDLCVRMEHEIGSLKEHLDARERNLLDVNSRLSNCMNDLDIKLGEILELKEQNTQLLNDLTQSINERDQLKKTIENTEEMKLSHYDELTSENMSLTHEINSLNEQLEESRAALALATQKNTEVTLKSTEEKLSIATSETIAAQEMIEKLTTELATLQTELISLREKEVQDTAKMNSLADQLVDTLAAKKKLELQMIDSDKELNKKIVQLNSYQMDSESWGKTIEQLKQEVDSLKETVEKVTVDNESLRSQTSNYRASIKDLTKQNEQLKQQSDDLRKISLFTNDMEAFRAQDIELRRLTDTVERLAKQVNSKEQELSKLMSTLKRKEGETAGLFSTLEGLNAEMEQIRVENEALAQSAAGLERQIKEIKRENVLLKSSSQLHKNELQTYKLQLSATKTKQSDENKYDAYHSEEASRSFALKIRETVASLAKKYKITDLRGLSENSNNYDKQDVVEYLLNPFFRRIDSLLQKNEHELKLKQMEVEELMHTKHNLSTTAVATPSVSRTTPDSDRRFNGSRTTPASSSRYSDAKMKLNSMSPTAKELARLNSEIVKERRKLQSLQEEHSDLLELLAQQEVELSVFRKAVEDRFGSNEFQNFEELAHKNVVEMYGTYTNFRDNLAID